MSSPAPRVRLGATALVVAAVLFVLYPALRPWQDSTVEGAPEAMSSPLWVVSHLSAVVGFILVPLGLLALHQVVAPTRVESLALAAAVTTWLGAGLTVAYYGAEVFGLNAIATSGKGQATLDVLAQVDAGQFGAAAATTFGIGLILLAVGSVLAAVAVWRSGVLPRYSGILFGVGFVLFLPQFFTPPAVRITHGALLAVGLAWLAVSLWRSTRALPTR